MLVVRKIDGRQREREKGDKVSASRPCFVTFLYNALQLGGLLFLLLHITDAVKKKFRIARRKIMCALYPQVNVETLTRRRR